MATVQLPEKNILPIADIEPGAIRQADESILNLIEGGDDIPYSPKPKVVHGPAITRINLSSDLYGTGPNYGTSYNNTKGIVGGGGSDYWDAYGERGFGGCREKSYMRGDYCNEYSEPRSADQETKFPTKIKKLKTRGWSFLSATEFYILYANNPRCWRWTDYKYFEAADLLHSDSIELKGVVGKEQFEAGKRYDVEFLIKMDINAKLNTKSRFTAVLPEPNGKCSIYSKLVNLKEQVTPNVWTLVKVGDFIATESGEDIRFSLTNFDHYWKNGLSVAGVLFHPSTA